MLCSVWSVQRVSGRGQSTTRCGTPPIDVAISPTPGYALHPIRLQELESRWEWSAGAGVRDCPEPDARLLRFPRLIAVGGFGM